MEFAEPGERLIAYIIDVLIIVGVVILLSVIGAIFLVILPIVSIFFWVAATAFGFVYFPYFWAKDGQTIGNRQRHIRVVRDVDGGPLSMGTAILRLVGYWISGGGLLHWLHLDPHRQTAPRVDGPHRGHGRGQGLSIRSIARLGTALALLAWTVVLAGCVPGQAKSSSPSAAPSAPAGWQEHPIGDTPVQLALPEGWLTLDQADLADPDVRRQLEADFAGADALFAKLDAQGDRAPLVFLGVDPSERGTGRFPSVVTAIAVEPALPPLLLGIGADLASDAFESTFEMETDVTRSDIDTPLGDGIRLQFTHRLVGPEGGPGFAVEHDGAIVTTGDETFLVSRNVVPETARPTHRRLEEILATLRDGS